MSGVLLNLSTRSLWNRRVTSGLTVLSVACSVALLLAVGRIRQGAEESFANTISQTDLIVGARGGTTQLLLYSIFHVGTATQNLSFESFARWSKHPAVAWVIPISLGDSHRGYRVVATDQRFFEHYRFMRDRQVELRDGGRVPADVFDVALGSEVATKLHYKTGDAIVLAHGVGEGAGFVNHQDKPFTVSGILKPTGTPLDRSLYITLAGMEAIHADWQDGAPPARGSGISAAEVRKQPLEVHELTAFLVRTKTRIETLHLQREINTDTTEALTAIIPGVALQELWTQIGYAEVGLRAVSWVVVAVSMIGMMIALYSSLSERRREMAILRALGARSRFVGILLVSEALLLVLAGALLGICATYGLVAAASPWIRETLGLAIPWTFLAADEAIYLLVLLGLGLVVSLLPAYTAYRNALHDGLSVRL